LTCDGSNDAESFEVKSLQNILGREYAMTVTAFDVLGQGLITEFTRHEKY